MFPLSITYTTSIQKLALEKNEKIILKYMNDFMIEKTANRIETGINELTFYSDFIDLRRWSYHVLSRIEKGVFTVLEEDSKVTIIYEFFLYRFFIISVAISILAGILSHNFLVVAFIFVWMFVIDYGITLISQKRMFNKIIAGISNIIH